MCCFLCACYFYVCVVSNVLFCLGYPPNWPSCNLSIGACSMFCYSALPLPHVIHLRLFLRATRSFEVYHRLRSLLSERDTPPALSYCRWRPRECVFFLEESCVLLDAAFSATFHLQCNQRCYEEEGCSLCLQTVGRMEVRIRRVPVGSTCCTFESWERDSHLHEVWCTPTSDLGVTSYGSRITGCHTCCAGPTEKGGGPLCLNFDLVLS